MSQPLRICVVGAESTGTTTLAQALAAHYHTLWVPEYGREYTERLVERVRTMQQIGWRTEDFLAIARRQLELEDEAARNAGRVLFCDTDVLATSIWHERYMRSVCPELEQMAAARHYALYILTDCDIPFVQDGFRDGEHIREWMTRRFREELAKRPEPWFEVRGSVEQRMAAATAAVDRLLVEPGFGPASATRR